LIQSLIFVPFVIFVVQIALPGFVFHPRAIRA
jgi:hypothetical protein